MIKSVLLDFDGTLVTHDILDVLCDLNGSKSESEQLNKQFHEGKLNGVTGLVKRINLLSKFLAFINGN